MSRFKKVLTSKAYWKSVRIFAIGFIIIYNFIMLAFDGFDTTSLVQKATNQPLRFFIANIVSGIIYGMIISYFQVNKNFKELER